MRAPSPGVSEDVLPHPTNVPSTVRWSAWLFVVYGLIVLAGATVAQALNDWAAIGDYPRAVIRAAGVTLIAWALMRRRWWAWWMGVGLGLLWAATGWASFVALIVLLAGSADESVAVEPGFVVVSVLTLVVLTAAVTLLLLPRSRAPFRRGVGPV